MGNKPSIKLSSPDLTLSPLDWAPLTYYDNRRILRHLTTKQQIQQFPTVIYQPDQLIFQKKVFQFRFNSPVLVSALYFTQHKSSQLCSESYKGSVYLENIVLRLNQVDMIPFTDMIYVLGQCLRGFEKVFGFYGGIKVGEEMVCVNRRAEVKVWICGEIERSVPEGVMERSREVEARMVRSIVEMVERNSNSKIAPFRVREALFKVREQIGFKEVIGRLEGIVIKNNLEIPKCLSSLKKLLQRVGRADPFEVIRMKEEVKREEVLKQPKMQKVQVQIIQKQQQQFRTIKTQPEQQSKIVVNLKQKRNQIMHNCTTSYVKVSATVHPVSVPFTPFVPVPTAILPHPQPKTQNTSATKQHPNFYRKPSLSTLQPSRSATKIFQPQQPIHSNQTSTITVYKKHSHSNSKQFVHSQSSQCKIVHQQVSHSRNNSKSSIGKNSYSSNEQRVQEDVKQLVTYQYPEPIVKNIVVTNPRPLPMLSKIVPLQIQYIKQQHIKRISHLQMQSSNVYPTKNQSGVLPTAASFEMNTTFTNNNNVTKERFITSPSLGNTSYSVNNELSSGLQSPTNSQRIKNKLFQSGFKNAISLNPYQSINKEVMSYENKINQINKRQELQNNNIRHLSKETLSYLKTQPINRKAQYLQKHAKTLSNCVTQSSRQRQETDLIPKTQHRTFQPPIIQISQQLVASMKSISFKKQKQLNSFSFDDLENFFDQKKERTLSKEEIEEFENELAQQMYANYANTKNFVRKEGNYQGLFEEKESDSEDVEGQKIVRPTYQRPHSTKGVQHHLHRIQPKVLRYDQEIPEVNVSEQQKSYLTLIARDLSKDLFELQQKEATSRTPSQHSILSLNSYQQSIQQ